MYFINSFFMTVLHLSHKNLLPLLLVYPREDFDHLLISTRDRKRPESVGFWRSRKLKFLQTSFEQVFKLQLTFHNFHRFTLFLRNQLQFYSNLMAFTIHYSLIMSIDFDYNTLETNKIRYEYDNIGDLLTNIESVLSVLFKAKYLIFSVYSYFHQQSILKSFIDYYYPEFKQIEVIKGWRHRILIVKQGNKYLDINEYIKFRNKLQDIMQTKLSLSNILYELSRITFALRSMKTHLCGVKLCLPEMKVTQFDFNSEHPQSSRSQSDDSILNEEDCHILSIDERGLFKSRRTSDVESQDFYDLNTIQ